LIKFGWVVPFIAVTLISFLLADITNLLLGSKLEASASLIPKAGQDVVRLNPLLSAGNDTNLIVEGNIFNAKLRGKKEEQKSPAAAAQPIAQQMNLALRYRLVGTSEGSPENSFAVIEDLQSREQTFYHLNDHLAGNPAQIARIRRNEVQLAYAGGSETLRIQLEEEKTALPPPPPAGNPNPAADAKGIRQLGSNKWVLDRNEVAHHLDNLNQLMTQARVVPNFSDGKPDGFRMFAIVPDSFYDQIGLKNGDILERVNGIEIKDPESFLSVFQRLKDENNINVDVIRNAQKETMSYEIR
jgi:general secretion pathway protein C